jgi:hypothetical protein
MEGGNKSRRHVMKQTVTSLGHSTINANNELLNLGPNVESPKLQSIESGGRESSLSRPMTKNKTVRASVELPYNRRMNKTIAKNSFGSTGGQKNNPLMGAVKAHSSIGRKTLVSSIDYPKGAFKYKDSYIQPGLKA